MVRNDKQALANEVAGVVKHLASTSTITDYRQAVILAPSTKDSVRKASFRYFREAFAKQGIPVYNPGAKNLHGQARGLCLAIDKDDVFGNATEKSKVKQIRDAMTTQMNKNAELKATIEAWQTTFDQPSSGPPPRSTTTGHIMRGCRIFSLRCSGTRRTSASSINPVSVAWILGDWHGSSGC